MSVQRKSKQRGISFLGLIVFGSLIAMAGVVAAQVFPTVIEFMAVQKAAQKAANEGQTPAEIRMVFDRASAIDDIKSIASKELEISKQGDKVVVAFSYQREIHLFGPAFLTLKYEGRSK
jgi:beta-lactam-binding protein with PASTA domain